MDGGRPSGCESPDRHPAQPADYAQVVAVTLATIVFGGAVLGVLYERTGNLAVPIVAHGLVNSIVFAVSLALVL